MAAVATTAATFLCPHSPGAATVTAATTIHKIDSVDIVVATDVVGSTISGCTWVPTGEFPSRVACTSVVALVSGASTILQKGGAFVILTGATFSTNGNGGAPPLLTVTETQTKYVST